MASIWATAALVVAANARLTVAGTEPHEIGREAVTAPHDNGGPQFRPETDRAALVALYEATEGDHWLRREHWLSADPISTWEGVTTDDEGRVWRLDLSENQLSGDIAAAVGNLTGLTHLGLSGNQLSGDIAAAVGNLTELTYLDLTGNQNQLSGDIAAAVANLTELTYLDLTGNQNQLSGDIAAAVANLTGLTYLDLTGDQNQLSGDIAAAVGNLTELRGLNLAGDQNQLSGDIAAAVGHLTELRALGLYGNQNQLSGDIAAAVGHLTELMYLNLGGSQNQLSGDIAAAVGHLTGLRALGLGGKRNQLSGDIAAAFGNLTELRALSLGGKRNQLSGDIAAAFGNLTGLEYLNLGGDQNQLSGDIAAAFGNLTGLTALDLGGKRNQLSGDIAAAVGNLTGLWYLALYGDQNQLNGDIAAAVGHLTQLEVMDLSGDQNQLSGDMSAAVGHLTGLEYLNLAGNQLGGDMSAAVGYLTGLRTLNLAGNQLSGDMSAAVGYLTQLEVLDLSNNHLSGEIPSALGELQMIRSFNVAGNRDLHDGHADLCSLNITGLGGATFADLQPTPSPDAGGGAEWWRSSRGSPEGAASASSTEQEPEASERATFHMFSVHPIELYDREITKLVAKMLCSSADDGGAKWHWQKCEATPFSLEQLCDLDMGPVHTFKARRRPEASPQDNAGCDDGGQDDSGPDASGVGSAVPESSDESPGGQGDPSHGSSEESGNDTEADIYAVVTGTVLCIVYHRISSTLQTSHPGDTRLYKRIEWALRVFETPPSWVQEALPYNSQGSLYRAVWIWMSRRHIRDWWDPCISKLADCLEHDIEQSLDKQGILNEKHRELVKLIKSDQPHRFNLSAAHIGAPTDDADASWREHFSTTAHALDILNAVDDGVHISRESVSELRGLGALHRLQRTQLLLQQLMKRGVVRKLLTAQGQFANEAERIVSELSKLNLEQVRDALAKHQPTESSSRNIRSEWLEQQDGDKHFFVQANPDSVTVATAHKPHINDIAAMEIALQVGWSSFARASGRVLQAHEAFRERDQEPDEEALAEEDDLLDALSDQRLRVTRWRAQFSGWQRSVFEHLRQASGLDANIEAFYDASEEAVQRSEVVREKRAATREARFQRAATIVGLGLAGIVLGEITLSIAGGTGGTGGAVGTGGATSGGELERTAALLVGLGSFVLATVFVWQTFLDWRVSVRWVVGGVGVVLAFLMLLAWSGLASVVGLHDLLGWLFPEAWWPWPGLPFLGVTLGWAAGVVVRVGGPLIGRWWRNRRWGRNLGPGGAIGPGGASGPGEPPRV